MAADRGQGPADPQSLTNTDLHIYEAIATLEQTGHPPTRREIAAASGLGEDTVAERLRALHGRGVVVETSHRGETAFTLASHEWSSVSGEPGA
jgi:SOS-response transcriptional repressor LexA